MRRRTKKLSPRRAIIYIVILAFLVGARVIRDNLDSSLTTPSAEAAATELPASKPAGNPSDDAPVKPQGESAGNNTQVQTYRSGWAELPNERNDKDLYYAHHTIGQGADQVRNYSVCFSREQCCPVWVAFPLHPSYKGEAKRVDNYRPDPQLPVNIQPSLKRSYGGEYSRGHMLGSAERNISREANDQTFYASNIAPQIRVGFNAAGGAWNNLESLVDRQVCSDTLYVVTGCIFAPFTDSDGALIEPTQAPNQNDGKQIGVPTAYYKALLRTQSGASGKSVRKCRAEELKCAAFIVGHRSAKGRKPSVSEMLSIEELEHITGERFFTNVKNAPKSQANPSDWGL